MHLLLIQQRLVLLLLPLLVPALCMPVDSPAPWDQQLPRPVWFKRAHVRHAAWHSKHTFKPHGVSSADLVRLHTPITLPIVVRWPGSSQYLLEPRRRKGKADEWASSSSAASDQSDDDTEADQEEDGGSSGHDEDDDDRTDDGNPGDDEDDDLSTSSAVSSIPHVSTAAAVPSSATISTSSSWSPALTSTRSSPASTSTSSSRSQSATGDCALLAQLYHDLNGPQWTISYGWPNASATSCCNAYGVSCNSQSRIMALDLARNGLSGNLSTAVFGLTQLNKL